MQNFLRKKSASLRFDICGMMGAGFLAGAVVHTFVAEVRYVPSPSMQPTIEKRDRILLDKLHYRSSLPERQDIVVFKPPEAVAKLNIQDSLIKRVIGLPGEQVQVKHGQVYINNQPLKEDYIAEPPKYNWGPQVVPLQSYLVLGDNRNQSFDGHDWGFVPQDRIIVRTFMRFWPFYRVRFC